MANEIKYLSYEGLTYYTEKLFREIEDDEEVIATSLVDLDTRLRTHTHTQYAPTSHTHNYSPTSHSHSNATTTAAGFMSGLDKKKLDGLSTVATTGSYNDLLNKPTIPTVYNGTLTIKQNGTTTLGTFTANQSGSTNIDFIETQPNWNETTTTSPAHIRNKPNLATVATSGSYTDLSNKPVIVNSTTATWYYPTFVINTSTSTEYINSGFTVYTRNGNTTTLGDVTLVIGSAASGTVKAQKGFLTIHGESNRTTLNGPEGTGGANYTVNLPAETGTLVVKNTSGDVKATSFTENGTSLANKYAAKSHTHTTVKLSTASNSSYYPVVFTNSTSATDSASLYIDNSTGTASSSTGIRYNPSSNACYCSGGFFEASDERLKNFTNDIEVDLDKLSKLSKKYFTWKDDESNTQHIGVSAQEVQELYPEIVNTIDEEGHLSVSYDKLSVVALKGIDVLNNKIKSLEERLERLEKLIDNK